MRLKLILLFGKQWTKKKDQKFFKKYTQIKFYSKVEINHKKAPV